MAFKGKKFGSKKKSEFVTVGNMFKAQKPPVNATLSYSTTCSEQYLEKVVEGLTKILEEGGAARFTLIKWNDSEHPRLSFGAAQAKPGKRIKGEDEGFQGGDEDQGGL